LCAFAHTQHLRARNPCASAIVARMQQTAVTPKQLAQELVQFLNTAMRAGHADFFEVIDELGVTLTQFKIMHLLDFAGEERTPSELARTIGLSPAAASRAADALARQGILRRRDDGEDRRVKWLSLTAKGHKVLAHLTDARVNAVARLTGSLDDEQRAALSEALAPLLTSEPDSSPNSS
jgi:DNA-binding MarR family transcriptional regulator